ncbi:unnamed protein product [Bemisia tabaci]|uniref:Protein FAM114A2 n=1 Tax=Bemisia tabaci TaxID=7038 RepID=A0A9P0AAG4_BEMTA|nr:unnamed protein product [Bemisia tabaci]
MADSDSDQFESADEELSDNEEPKTPLTLSSAAYSNKATSDVAPEIVQPQSKKININAGLQKLSLHESATNAEESLARKLNQKNEEIPSASSVPATKVSGTREEAVVKPISNIAADKFEDEASDSHAKKVASSAPEVTTSKTSTTEPIPQNEKISKLESDNSSYLEQQEVDVLHCPEDNENFEDEGWDVEPLSDNDLSSETPKCVLQTKIATTVVNSDVVKVKQSEEQVHNVRKGSESTSSGNSDQLPSQTSLKSSSLKNSELSLPNNDRNVPESSQNDGWDDDFEIEDDLIEAKLSSGETVAPSDAGITANLEDDEGWNDGWDTEEVTFSPERSETEKSKKGLEPSKTSQPTKDSILVDEAESKNVSGRSTLPMTTSKAAVPEKYAANQQQGNQDGWFGWGVTNILSSATEGLSSITSNVTSAFESTIGAPDPSEILLAQKELGDSNAPEKSTSKEPTEIPKEEDSVSFGGNLFSVSSWTKFVESTGNKVLTTGLDTLETIGKKTMEVLQEGDPGLKKKRAKLREFVAEPGKPVLSQVLREAKEKAETSSRKNESALIESKANFEILFDDFEGLVHLEALEMISKQCQIKLDSLALTFSGKEATNFKETLLEIEEFCELPEDDESISKEAMADNAQFKLKIKEVLTQLDVEIQYSKLLEASDSVENRLNKDFTNPLELHQIIISSLAEICAAAMLIFHRAAEMLVIKQKHSTVSETESLMSFGKCICSKLEITAEQFSLKLRQIDPSDTAKTSHISKETSNSVTYTKTACQLLVPILQYGAVV